MEVKNSCSIFENCWQKLKLNLKNLHFAKSRVLFCCPKGSENMNLPEVMKFSMYALSGYYEL